MGRKKSYTAAGFGAGFGGVLGCLAGLVVALALVVLGCAGFLSLSRP